jgi:hypothetical protein
MTRACALLVAVLLAAAPAARANVAPPTMLLVHVQSLGPNACDLPGMYSCANLTQTTSETGELLFVVYLQTSWTSVPITSLDFSVRWDGGWWLEYLAPCIDGQFSYDDWGGEVMMHFAWPNHPYLHTFQPICVLEIGVNNPGCFEVDGGGSIHWGYPEGWYETPLPGKAEAGVDCAYSCLLDCNPWSTTCEPQLTPEELHFELAPGQVGLQTMHLVTTGGQASSVAFDATEPWVAFNVTVTGNHDADVRLSVNTAGLAPGEYSARARATCDGRDCSEITLTVLDIPQSVPDDESPAPSGATPTTWGGVKNLFRGPPR